MTRERPRRIRSGAVLRRFLVGVIAYHAFAARLDGWFRAAIVGGGLLAYLATLAIGAALGGLV